MVIVIAGLFKFSLSRVISLADRVWPYLDSIAAGLQIMNGGMEVFRSLMYLNV